MLHVTKEILNKKIGITNLLITEYYPIVRGNNSGRGLKLPYSNHVKGVSVVFSDLANRAKVRQSEVVKGPNKSKLLTFEAYQSELHEFMDMLADKNGITVRSIDERLLYKTYKDVHTSFTVAGVVNIIDYSMSNLLNNLEYIPAEANICYLGFSSYIRTVHRTLPKLSLDYRTARRLYDNYVAYVNRPRTEAEEVPLLLKAGSNKNVTELVDKLTSKLSPEDILLILKGDKPDSILNEYFKFMTVKFGCREALSRVLLYYKTGIVENYIEQLHDDLGLPLDRTTCVIEEYQEEEQFNGLNYIM